MKIKIDEFKQMLTDTTKAVVGEGTAPLAEGLKALDARLGDVEKRQARVFGDADTAPPETKKSAVGFPKLVAKEDGRGLKKDEFSFIRAAIAINRKDFADAGYEQEVFRASEKVLTWASGSGGGYFTAPEFLPQSFIEALRAAAVVHAAGATVMTVDGASTVRIPTVTASTTAAWSAQDGSISASDVTPGEVTLSPKILGARSIISKLLAFTSAGAAEQIVRADLAKTLALGLDAGALHGTGSSNQPTGIALTSGIGSVALGTNGATPTTTTFLDDLIYAVMVDNAMGQRGAWIVHPRTYSVIAKLLDSANRPLLQPDVAAANKYTLKGYPVLISSQIPINLTKGTSSDCSRVYFGFFENLLIGNWAGLRIEASDTAYDAFDKDNIWIKAVQWADIAVRHAESFSMCADIRG